MRNCHDFVLLGSKRLFDLRYIDGPAKVSMQLVDFGPIRLKASSSRGKSIQRAHTRCDLYMRTNLQSHRRNIPH